MYQLINAYVEPRGAWSGTLEKDISNEPIREVYTTSRRVILVVSHPQLTDLHSIDLVEIEEEIYALEPGLTTLQWLAGLGDTALPTRIGVPTITTNRVKSVQAFIAGYEVEIWDKTTSPGATSNSGPGHDLKLSRAQTEDEPAGAYMLASVNGCMHITDYTSSLIYIEGAGVSATMADAPSIQLMSFKDIGKVKQIPFNTSVVSGLEGHGMRNGVWVQVPEDTVNQSVMISIAGILHTDQQYWGVTGDRTLYLNWRNLGIREAYLNTRDRIDWSAVEALMTKDPESIDGISEESFYSDEVITAILNMPQSFIILIDHPVVKTSFNPLEGAGIPGKWYKTGEVDYPLRLSSGLIPAFIPIREKAGTRYPVWVLGIDASASKRYQYYSDKMNTGRYDFLPLIERSDLPFDYHDGYFLEIEGIHIDLP